MIANLHCLKNRDMKATWNGVTLAESDDTVIVEGNHYFPEARDRKSTRLNSSHLRLSRMPSSA